MVTARPFPQKILRCRVLHTLTKELDNWRGVSGHGAKEDADSESFYNSGVCPVMAFARHTTKSLFRIFSGEHEKGGVEQLQAGVGFSFAVLP